MQFWLSRLCLFVNFVVSVGALPAAAQLLYDRCYDRDCRVRSLAADGGVVAESLIVAKVNAPLVTADTVNATRVNAAVLDGGTLAISGQSYFTNAIHIGGWLGLNAFGQQDGVRFATNLPTAGDLQLDTFYGSAYLNSVVLKGGNVDAGTVLADNFVSRDTNGLAYFPTICGDRDFLCNSYLEVRDSNALLYANGPFQLQANGAGTVYLDTAAHAGGELDGLHPQAHIEVGSPYELRMQAGTVARFRGTFSSEGETYLKPKSLPACDGAAAFEGDIVVRAATVSDPTAFCRCGRAAGPGAYSWTCF